MENILEINNLCKNYHNFALKNVTFNLPKGTIMGFIGENGSGKTTTIKAILNLIKYQGSIKIYNNETNEDIGVVLDDMFYPEILTPNDISNSMRQIYKNWDAEMFNNFLKEFSMPSNKQIKTFSKGMRKKLEIISAICHKPKLLILDEPTSNLDPIARAEVIDMFQDFVENPDCSILFSTHITSDLEHVADYITFINDGEILLSKTRDELLDKYGIVKCNTTDFKKIAKEDYVKYRKTKYEYEVLIENKKEFNKKYHLTTIDNLSLDDLMLLMIKGEE